MDIHTASFEEFCDTTLPTHLIPGCTVDVSGACAVGLDGNKSTAVYIEDCCARKLTIVAAVRNEHGVALFDIPVLLSSKYAANVRSRSPCGKVFRCCFLVQGQRRVIVLRRRKGTMPIRGGPKAIMLGSVQVGNGGDFGPSTCCVRNGTRDSTVQGRASDSDLQTKVGRFVLRNADDWDRHVEIKTQTIRWMMQHGSDCVWDQTHVAAFSVWTQNALLTVLVRSALKPLQLCTKRSGRDTKNWQGIQHAIVHSLLTGNWRGANMLGVTAAMNVTNHTSAITQLTKICTSIADTSPSVELRMVHGSTLGYICPACTPEGTRCGLTSALSVGTRPSPAPPKRCVEAAVAWANLACRSPNVQHDPIHIFVDGVMVGQTRAAASAHTLQTMWHNARQSEPGALQTVGAVVADHDAQPCLKRCLWLQCCEGRLGRIVDGAWFAAAEMYSQSADYPHIRTPPLAETLLGHAARTMPYANCSQGPRLTYAAAMEQQMISGDPEVPLASVGTSHRLWYSQKPLVSTAEEPMCATGINMITAIAMHDSWGIEDALIINKAFLERGGMRMSAFRIYDTTHCSRVIGKPNPTELLDDDGMPAVGAAVLPGQAVMQFAVPPVTRREQPSWRDWTFADRAAPAVIHEASVGQIDDETQVRRVTTREMRTVDVGDKLCSRHAQKAVVSIIVPQEDMMYDPATGMGIDLIINPCAFPSRMTMSQLIEAIKAIGACADGKIVDGSPFSYVDDREDGSDRPNPRSIADLQEELKRIGLAPSGKKVMICGKTGRAFTEHICVGCIYYARLGHLANDKCYARRHGPYNPETLQPTEGRKHNGGLRVGEMEVNAIVSTGASAVLTERMRAGEAPGGHRVPMCQACSLPQSCCTCPEPRIELIQMSRPMELLMMELAAMTCKMQCITNKV
jgi:DNA-directed RNA polymerase subunit B